MANLKEIRNRISSTKTTRQITSAMKMVSAAKLRKAQDAIIQMRPYATTLQDILNNLMANIDNAELGTFLEKHTSNKVLFVCITSNKGLCGAFNSNIVKRLIVDILDDKYLGLYKSGKVDIFCIGRKGADQLKSKGFTPTKSFHHFLDSLAYSQVSEMATDIINRFVKGEYHEIKLYYNSFKNAGTQIITCQELLPITLPEKKKKKEGTQTDYILEPSQNEIVKELIPKSLKIELYKALLDSNASEQGARMTAMHKATDNATELIKTYQLDYNKARQATITNEILEIVGGAEALKG
jgi:F-type H+-transporting ATPase subunit gamma